MTALEAEKLYYETYLRLKMKATDEGKFVKDRDLSLKGFQAILDKVNNPQCQLPSIQTNP